MGKCSEIEKVSYKLNRIILFFGFYIWCISQNGIDTKISIMFDNEPVRESLINMLNKAKVNFIISNEFEKNRFITTSYRRKTVRKILDDFSKYYLFEYVYNPHENFVSIHYKPKTIRGYILTVTNDPIKDAVIYSKTLNKHTSSNENGYFFFENIAGKESEFDVSHVQFYKETYKVKQDNFEKPQQVYLNQKIYKYSEQSIFELPTLTFTPVKNEIILNQFVKKGLSSSDDVFQSIKMLPGIGGLGEGNTKIQNRGTSSAENQILFDNIPLYHSEHLNGFYSIFNPKTLDKIYLHRGVYSPKYGGQLSGVVELKGKQASYMNPVFSAGANNLSYFGQMELPIASNMSILLAGRSAFTSIVNSSFYRKIRNFSEASGEEFATGDFLSELTPEITFQDFNGKLSYIPSNDVFIEFNFIKSFDTSTKIDQSEFDINLGNISTGFKSVEEKENEGYSVNSLVQWSQRFNSSVSIAKSIYTNRKLYSDHYTISWEPDSSYFYSFDDINTLTENRILFESEYYISPSNKIDFGVFFRKVKLSEKIGDTDNADLSEINATREHSFFLSHLWKATDWIKTDFGVRQNINKTHDIKSFEPRLSIVFEPKRDVSFKLSYGKFHQTLYQLRVDNSNQLRAEKWLLADNDEIPVSISNKYQLNASFLWDKFKFSIDTYYNKHENLINYHRFLPVRFPEIYTSKGTSSGMEFFIERSFTKFDFWTSYSYMKMNIPISLRGLSKEFKKPTHSLKLMSNYRSNNWQFSINMTAQSGEYYQTEISVNDYEAFNFNNTFSIFSLPLIHKMDLKIQRFVSTTLVDWNFALSVLNVYNQKNILRREMNEFAFTEETHLFNDIYMLGITPILSIEALF